MHEALGGRNPVQVSCGNFGLLKEVPVRLGWKVTNDQCFRSWTHAGLWSPPHWRAGADHTARCFNKSNRVTAPLAQAAFHART